VVAAATVPYDAALVAHTAAWAELWEQSWVVIGGEDTAVRVGTEEFNVTQMGLLGRYVDLSQGGGPYPIKWQGGLFHYDSPPTTNDIDSHGWGGAYWIWETRYPYYATGPAGDFAMERPWFDMYLAQLPLARARTEQLYKHKGGIFVETSYLWGTPPLTNFAEHCNRTLPPGGGCKLLTPGVPIDSTCDTENPYIRHFFSGSLEVCVMALRRWEYTQDDAGDALRYLIPLADAVLEFYTLHWCVAVLPTLHCSSPRPCTPLELFAAQGLGNEQLERADAPAELLGLRVLAALRRPSARGRRADRAARGPAGAARGSSSRRRVLY
jgi:hypothetical protein